MTPAAESRSGRLRSRLARGELVAAIGAHDPMAARLIELAGFSAVYVGSYTTSAAYAMLPDLGLLSFAEMLDHAARCAAATSLPVIADVDTGYGGILNVQRTVRAYERAGIAAIHIEDQAMPKKCGHIGGKIVIPAMEMAQKIAAAVAARSSEDFLIIGRTDARQSNGLDDALERCRLYKQAGADVLFVDAPESLEEIATVGRSLKGPLLFNASLTGKSPLPTEDELKAMGFSIVIYPWHLMGAALRAMQEALETIKRLRKGDALAGRSLTFAEINDLVGLEKDVAVSRLYEELNPARADPDSHAGD